MKVVCLICSNAGKHTELESKVIAITKVEKMKALAEVIAPHLEAAHRREFREIQESMFRWITFNTLNCFEDPATEIVEESEYETEKEELREMLMEQLLMNAPDNEDEEEDEEGFEGEEGEEDEEEDEVIEVQATQDGAGKQAKTG